jgi:hypothetical protein
MNDDKLVNYFDDILTEEEKSKIEHIFLKDEVMYNALKKVFLKGIYSEGTVQKGHNIDPQVNAAFSLVGLAIQNPIPDDELGRHLRGMWAGVTYMVNAFSTLDKIRSKKVEEESSAVNEGV